MLDVTAAESNLQQVVGVFNFPAQTRFGTTNNGLQDAAAITIARVKYAPAYTGKPRVYRQRLCPAFYWPLVYF